MYGTYSDLDWEPEEWYYKGFPRKEDRPQRIKPIIGSKPLSLESFTWESNDDDYDDGDWSKGPKTGK